MIRFVWGLLALSALLTPGVVCAASSVPETELVRIPGGELMPLYSESKKANLPGTKNVPAKPERVASFALSRYPVTKGEFLEFVRENPQWRKSAVRPLFADRAYLRSWSSDLEIPGSAREPVTEVSWFAAKAFCKSRGERLPTTREWEYVGRASETKREASEDAAYLARILDWYGRRDQKLPEVGTWSNVYGVYDLHGVIWEWVSDFNSALVTGESRGDAQTEKDQFCGGGAMFASEKQKRDYAAFMRFAFRSSLEGAYALPQLGFRCAKDVEASAHNEGNKRR